MTAPKRPRSSKLADLPLIEPSARHEWRSWLAEMHDSSSGVWLAVGKKGAQDTALGYEDAVEEALCFGWIDAKAMTLDEHRFRILMTPRKPGSIWAKSNKRRVERLLESGCMAPSGLAVIEAAKADGSWSLFDDVEDLVVPPDLAEALAAAAGAAAGFDRLSPGARKLALYWIATAKRPQTRANRIAETVAAAAEGRAPR